MLPKDYEALLSSQCANCSLQFKPECPRATKLRVLTSEENSNSADFEEYSNLQILSSIYGVPIEKLISNLMTNLKNAIFNQTDFSRGNNSAGNISSDIANTICLSLCRSCAPKLAELYGSHKNFVKTLTDASFVTKAIKDPTESFNKQFDISNPLRNNPISVKVSDTELTSDIKFDNDIDCDFLDSQSDFSDTLPSHESLDENAEQPKSGEVFKSSISNDATEKSTSSEVNRDNGQNTEAMPKLPTFPSRMYCEICNLQFTSDYAICAHKAEKHEGKQLQISRIHMKGPPFICPFDSCGRKYAKQHSVKYHCLKVHDLKLLSPADDETPSFCNICQFTFPTSSGFRLHWVKVHESKDVPKVKINCNTAESEIESESVSKQCTLDVDLPQLQIQISKCEVTANTNIRCLRCMLVFNDLTKFIIHENLQHKPTTKRLKRKYEDTLENQSCEEQKKNDENYSAADSTKIASESNTLQVDQFVDPEQNFSTHTDVVKGPPYNCPKCPKFFKKLESLKFHCGKIHQLLLPAQRSRATVRLSCCKCSAWFKSVVGLKNHCGILHKLRFFCGFCHEGFLDEDSLNIHQCKNDSNPETEENTVGASTSSTIITSNVVSGNKLRSEMSHNEAMRHPPFKCPMCSSSFNIKSSLRDHWTNVHELKWPFQPFQQMTKSELLGCIPPDHPFFTNGSEFSANMKPKGEHRKYYCKECDVSWHNEYKLLAHNKLYHRSWERYFCKYVGCNTELQSISLLLDHYASTHITYISEALNLKEIFHCFFCEKSFDTNSKYNIHVKSDHDFFKCSKCHHKFATLEFLDMHMKRHSPNYKETNCEFCDKQFSTCGNMALHRRYSHPKEMVLPDTSFECPMCKKSFKRKLQVEAHIKSVHSKSKPFKCTICPRTFAMKSVCKQHILAHTQEPKFKCTQCTASFHKLHTLQNHRVVHLKERPFVCHTCGYSFKSKTCLNNHSMIHQEKKYFCDKCGSAFPSPHRLMEHMKSHNDERQICTICGLSLKKSAMKTHMEWKHVENSKLRAVCCLCGMGFRGKYRLRTHIQNKHPDEIYPEEIPIGKKGDYMTQPEKQNSNFVSNEFPPVHATNNEPRNSEEHYSQPPAIPNVQSQTSYTEYNSAAEWTENMNYVHL